MTFQVKSAVSTQDSFSIQSYLVFLCLKIQTFTPTLQQATFIYNEESTVTAILKTGRRLESCLSIPTERQHRKQDEQALQSQHRTSTGTMVPPFFHLHLPNVSPLIVSDHTGKVIFPLTLAAPHSEERHVTGAVHTNPTGRCCSLFSPFHWLCHHFHCHNMQIKTLKFDQNQFITLQQQCVIQSPSPL